MKKLIPIIFCLFLLVGCTESNLKTSNFRIGVAVYQSDDTYVSSIKDNIIKIAKEYEIKDNIKITVSIVDAAGQQSLQNDQVDSFIAKRYDAICVNMVDRTAAAVIIDKARMANIPVIFFNREPVDEDLERWDKVYYVGAKAEQSGLLQARILARAFSKNPEKIDKNNDGIIQYVMLEGELGHQDSLLRTEYAISTLTKLGIEVEKLANASASWQRSLSKEKMSGWMNQFGNSIEVVFCNNDDMALGAIEALREGGYFGDDNSKKIIVLGIDATASGVESVKNNYLYATVLNDSIGQAKGIFELAYSVVTTGVAKTSVKNFDGKYLLTNYKEYTREN